MNYISVLVTFNRKKLLIECLDSLINQTIKPQKIILVDNASTDGTQELLNDVYGNNNLIDYIRLESNIGGSGGFYEGIKRLSLYDYEWVSLSDDDAVYKNNFFEEIFVSSKMNNSPLCFTGKVELLDGSIQLSHRRKLNNEYTLSEKIIEQSEYNNKLFNLDIFSFVGVVINKKIIDKIGLPEKDYFIWYDDIEYSLRVRKETDIININSAVIYHKVSLEQVDNNEYSRNWKEYYGLRNRYLTTIKHSKNKSIGYMYNLYKYLGMNAKLFVKYRKYQGHRKFCIKLYRAAFKDYLNNKQGINLDYMPGKQF